MNNRETVLSEAKAKSAKSQHPVKVKIGAEMFVYEQGKLAEYADASIVVNEETA